MNQLSRDDLTARPLGALLDEIGARVPTPGGGGVCALVAALGAALGQMVASFSTGRKDLAPHEAEIRADIERLRRSRELFLQLAAEDAAAFELLSAAMKRPKDDPERPNALAAAAVAASSVPQALIATCCETLRHLEAMASRSNRHLRSDLAIAAVLAEAAARASRWNVSINMPLLPEEQGRQALKEADALLATAAEIRDRVERACV